MREKIKDHWPVILALIIAGLLKAVLTITQTVPFNGDEAVIANMARHILQGARPTFFYGQAYMGSLDAWLVAAGFMVFGDSVSSIRIVQSGIYLGYIVSVWWLARLWFEGRQIHIFAVLICAIPPVLVSTYTTATLGGYGESLVFGNLILGLGYWVTTGGKQEKHFLWLLLGLISGLAFWTLGLAGVYLLAVGILGLLRFEIKRIPDYLIASFGFFIGSLPWWLYNFGHEWEAVKQLVIPNYSVDLSFTVKLLNFFFLGIPSIIGARFPWSSEFVSFSQLGLTILVYGSLLLWVIYLARSSNWVIEKSARILLILLSLSLILLLLASGFGADITGRYLLPLYLPITLGLASLTAKLSDNKMIFGLLFLCLIWGLNGVATGQAMSSSKKLTTQYDPITEFNNDYDEVLITFLENNGEYTGYTNYWVTYRLAFLSNERILFSPELPDKANMSYTPLYLRYQPYVDAANASDKVAIITTKHVALDAVLEDYFKLQAITYQDEQIGPYHVYYDLSSPFRPEEIGYGEAYTEETQIRWSEYIDD